MNRLSNLDFCSFKIQSSTFVNKIKRFNSTLKINTNPFNLANELSGKHLIGGKLISNISGKTFDVVNPATGLQIGTASLGDKNDVDFAVRTATVAQKSWGALPVRQRGELIVRCGSLLKEHSEELAQITSLETGKALRTESRIEAGVVNDIFSFFGGLAPEIKGTTIPWSPNSVTYTQRLPIGVVAAIIPWNAPLLLMALKIAPALVTGNSVIVKSAEEAPLCSLRLAQILNSILPPGVLNILSGYGPECGAPLVAHPVVGKVTFT